MLKVKAFERPVESAFVEAPKSKMNSVRWFLGFTTIGGLTQFHNSNKVPISQLVWLCLFLTGLGLTIASVATIFIEYSENLIVTTVTTEQHKSMPFPAITLCNNNKMHCGHLLERINMYADNPNVTMPILSPLCQLFLIGR